MLAGMRITEITPEVYAVEGEAVNWTILREGDALTLVDAGYPGDADDVLASVREVGGRPQNLEAVLVTHGHIDHIGGLGRILETYDVPVLTSAEELGNVRRERLEQAGPLDVLRNLWRPRMLTWSAHVMRAGGLRSGAVPGARAWSEPIGVPGGPVPVLCPGHTSGHTAYLVPRAGVLLTGDALVTGHPLSRVTGPQLLPPFFHHDAGGAAATLDALAGTEAAVVFPGHGPVFRGTPADAVAQVRAGETRTGDSRPFTGS